jgi:Ca2+-binding RTX toxin-like protein
MLFETLESRALLSATSHGPAQKVTVVNGPDTITVNGTDGFDNIDINQSGPKVVITDFLTGKKTTIRGAFKNLVVNAGGGNDTIGVVQTGLAAQDAAGNLFSTTIRGGAGADDLYLQTDGGIVTVLAEGGNDTVLVDTGTAQYQAYISGGAGDDTIDAFGTTGAQIQGDLGGDVITGSSGNDTINGGDGNDIIFGRAGNDTLNGNEGFDSLSGEDGDDSLYLSNGGDNNAAGVGNDVFFSPSAVDSANTLNGGDGYDRYFYSATAGPGDNVLVSVEGSFASLP